MKISLVKTLVSDLDEVLRMEADPETTQYILPNSKEEHQRMLHDPGVAHLLLMSEHQIPIGFVILAGLSSPHRSIEFRRIVIVEKGKGFGKAAIREVKRYCFQNLHAHRLWLDVLEENSRARYVYRAEGFVEEGRLRECLWLEGSYKNLIIMSLLESEYKNLTN